MYRCRPPRARSRTSSRCCATVSTGIARRSACCPAPGLVNLYVALAELAGRGRPTVTPEDVTNLARQSEPLARKTLAMFFAMLGTVAADLAVTTGARGGVYIAGGIVPRLVEQLANRSFARASRPKAAIASTSRRFRRTSSRRRCRRSGGSSTCSAIVPASARLRRSGGAARPLARRRFAARLPHGRSCSSAGRTPFHAAAPARAARCACSAGSEPPQPESRTRSPRRRTYFALHEQASGEAFRSQSSTGTSGKTET